MRFGSVNGLYGYDKDNRSVLLLLLIGVGWHEWPACISKGFMVNCALR